MSTNLAYHAYDHIRQKLLSGDLPWGGRLSETSLAKDINMSRTPVREALRWLQNEGIIEQRMGSGTYLRRLDRREVNDLWEVRELLEPHTAAQSAKLITEEELKALSEIGEQMGKVLRGLRSARAKKDRLPLLDTLAATDRAMHMLLMRVAGNAKLLKMIDDLRTMARLIDRAIDLPGSSLGQHPKAYLEHMRIIRAIARRDAEGARAAMATHMRHGRQRALAYWDLAERQAAMGRGENDKSLNVNGA